MKFTQSFDRQDCFSYPSKISEFIDTATNAPPPEIDLVYPSLNKFTRFLDSDPNDPATRGKYEIFIEIKPNFHHVEFE